MRIALIVARAQNGVIGVENQLPWHLPCDLKYFKRVTVGKPVMMGRKTYESIGRPLPGRTNVVVTRNPEWTAPGVRVVQDLPRAMQMAQAQAELDGVDEVMIIGGATLYQEALPQVDRMYVTEVAMAPEGDAFFPAPDPALFQMVSEEAHDAHGDSPAHSYQVWDRIRAN